MIQKSAPHGLIVPLILLFCHFTHLGQAAIDEQVFGRITALEGSVIQTASHYAVPVLAWFTVWSAIPILANILIMAGRLLLYIRGLIVGLGNVIALWIENKFLTELYVLLSKARLALAAEIRRRRGDTT